MSKINVCLSCDNNYAKHAGVVIASALANANDDDELAFYILNDGIEQNLIKDILSLKSIKPCEINFVSINTDMFEAYKKVHTHYYITLPTYYRLKLPSLLPDVNKIIYFDCDFVVCKSLKDLFNTDLGDCTIAGVNDTDRRKIKENPFYINAGMIVFDLDKMRKDNVEEQFLDWTVKNSDKIKLGDQEIINEVLKGKIKLVDKEWNVQSSNFTNRSSYTNNPKAVHILAKAWIFGTASVHKSLYFKYLQMTPWKLPYKDYRKWTYWNEIISCIRYFLKKPWILLRPRFYYAIKETYFNSANRPVKHEKISKRKEDNKRSKTPVEHIIVACCTYKRTDFLKNALNSMLSLNLPENIKTEILVVDNDKNCSAKEVITEIQKNSPIKINYVTEERTGLVFARNRVLNEAIKLGGTHLALIDDDEVVDKNWLIEHIKFYNENENIHVSSGPAYAKFDKEYPKYIITNSVFKFASSKEKGQLRNTCATNNVFMGLDIVKDNNLYFLEKFNFIGGEDGNFFHRVTKAGYNIAWNSDAVVYEVITKNRANLAWIFKRKYYNGYMGATLKFQNNKKFGARLFYIISKTLEIFVDIIGIILALLGGVALCINCAAHTVKNIGKLVGAIFMHPMSYYKDAGEDNVE